MKLTKKILTHHPVIFIFFGMIFGFLLSRGGATTHDFYAELFLFTNLQLIMVIVSATLTTMLGLQIIRRLKLNSLANQQPIQVEAKKKLPGAYFGACIFGVGWAISGSCPGTLPAMIGQGQLTGIVVFIGIFIGIWLYAKLSKGIK